MLKPKSVIDKSIYFLASIGDEKKGSKKSPILPIVVPVACVVTVLLGIFLIWWRIQRRIIGK
jgi:high-affinity Fe2+/Pb2+ permease